MLFYYTKASDTKYFIRSEKASPKCWIHVDEAKFEDLQKLESLTGIDPSLLEDALDRYELPRLEFIDEHLAIYTRQPVAQESSLYTSTLTILLTPNYFITISPTKTSLISELLTKKDILESDEPSDWLRHMLLWITLEFNLFVRRIRHRILSQEKDLNAVTSEDIYALTKYEETLNQYLATLDALELSYVQLFKLKSSNVYEQNEEAVEDLLNHVRQTESLCTIIIKNIRTLRDSYQIIFANNLTKTIKLLTALTIIFTVPNIVASVYGMNVKLPFAEGPEAFSLILGIMFLLSALCGYWFYRKNWM